jgi:hypothetical protein
VLEKPIMKCIESFLLLINEDVNFKVKTKNNSEKKEEIDILWKFIVIKTGFDWI